MAEYLPLYPGKAFSRTAGGTVTAGQLVHDGGGIGYTVTTATAGSTKVVGVVATDAVVGDTVTVHTGGVQRIVAGTGGITSGDVVAAGASGTVVAIGGGAFATQIGIALTTAAEGTRAEIQMDR